VRSVKLITNNPAKADGLELAGIEIDELRPLPVAAHVRNLSYLLTKQRRMGHIQPLGAQIDDPGTADVTALFGTMRPPAGRPFVVLKYAQSMDGRIATGTGDSKWISGEEERAVSHALRARCDAVMVGVGTVIADDPELTVRMVPGSSPMRVVVDSRLRIPLGARVLDDRAASLIITTTRAARAKRVRLRQQNVAVRTVAAGPGGVDLPAALRLLRTMGVESLLVEGGAELITSMLGHLLVDRLVVAVAPLILGEGVQGVGDLGVGSVGDGLRLGRPSVHPVGDDVLLAWDVEQRASEVVGATIDGVPPR